MMLHELKYRMVELAFEYLEAQTTTQADEIKAEVNRLLSNQPDDWYITWENLVDYIRDTGLSLDEIPEANILVEELRDEFTERHAYLKIFKDLPDGFDETWSGALLGGMADMSLMGASEGKLYYADYYKLAGDILVEQILSGGIDAYKLNLPTLNNYRHCLELYLKAILGVGIEEGHPLKELVKKLSEHIEANYHTKLPEWFKEKILEFDKLDPSGTSFRYPKMSKDSKKLQIDFYQLRKVMNALQEALRGLLHNRLEVFNNVPNELIETWQRDGLLSSTEDISSLDPSQAKLHYADYYKLSGDILVDQVLSGRFEEYELVFPVLYNYRHSLELYLKAVVQAGKKSRHNLDALIKDLNKVVKKRYNQELPEWFKERILEFYKFDPESDAFRYPDKPIAHLELLVDFRHLKRIMDVFQKILRGLMYDKKK